MSLTKIVEHIKFFGIIDIDKDIIIYINYINQSNINLELRY